MKRIMLAATVAALLAMPASGNAQTVEKIRGATYWSDSVWSTQLNGDPVVAFPLGCKGSKCDYLIRLEEIPEDAPCQEVAGESICGGDGVPGCIAWVGIGRAGNMLTFHGQDEDGAQIHGASCSPKSVALSTRTPGRG
jgi:hypothetical protein